MIILFPFNPFKPNGMSNYYQLGLPISVKGMFSGIFIFNRKFGKLTAETLIRFHVCGV